MAAEKPVVVPQNGNEIGNNNNNGVAAAAAIDDSTNTLKRRRTSNDGITELGDDTVVDSTKKLKVVAESLDNNAVIEPVAVVDAATIEQTTSGKPEADSDIETILIQDSIVDSGTVEEEVSQTLMTDPVPAEVKPAEAAGATTPSADVTQTLESQMDDLEQQLELIVEGRSSSVPSSPQKPMVSKAVDEQVSVINILDSSMETTIEESKKALEIEVVAEKEETVQAMEITPNDEPSIVAEDKPAVEAKDKQTVEANDKTIVEDNDKPIIEAQDDPTKETTEEKPVLEDMEEVEEHKFETPNISMEKVSSHLVANRPSGVVLNNGSSTPNSNNAASVEFTETPIKKPMDESVDGGSPSVGKVSTSAGSTLFSSLDGDKIKSVEHYEGN